MLTYFAKLKNKFFSSNELICGLELDRLSLRLFTCSNKEGNISNVSFGIEELPSGLIDDEDIINKKQMQEVLHNVKFRYNLKDIPVVTVINSRKIVTRYLELPNMSEKDLKSAVFWEAEQYLPYTPEEAVIDYVNLGSAATESNNMLGILVGAVPKEIAYDYYNLFTDAGLNLVAIDITAMALKRWLFELGKWQFPDTSFTNLCVINLGNDIVDLVIFQKGKNVFARSLKFSSKNFFEPFIDVNGNMEDVKEKIFSNGFLNSEQIEDDSKVIIDFNLRSAIQDLTKEVKDSVEYCQSKLALQPVAKFILTGSLSKIPGIKDAFAENFNIPVKIGNLKLPDEGLEIPAEIAVAAGLSLREV